jgi:hypothetical protein
MPFPATAPHPAPLSLVPPCLTPRTLAPRPLVSPSINDSNVGQCRPLRENPAPPALLEQCQHFREHAPARTLLKHGKMASDVEKCGGVWRRSPSEKQRNVIKCNHFRPRRRGLTLNTPRHRPLRPAHQSAPVVQSCSELARTLLDSTPKLRSWQPTRRAHLGQMWGSSPLPYLIVHRSSFIVPLRPAKPTHAFNPCPNPLP